MSLSHVLYLVRHQACACVCRGASRVPFCLFVEELPSDCSANDIKRALRKLKREELVYWKGSDLEDHTELRFADEAP